MPESSAPRANIPGWAVGIYETLGEIRAEMATVRALVTVTGENVNGMYAESKRYLTRDEYDQRHIELQQEIRRLQQELNSTSERRINPLWDSHNETKGEVKANARSNNTWRYFLSLAVAIVGVIATYAATRPIP
jgi:hypothetical protein